MCGVCGVHGRCGVCVCGVYMWGECACVGCVSVGYMVCVLCCGCGEYVYVVCVVCGVCGMVWCVWCVVCGVCGEGEALALLAKGGVNW